MTTEQPATMPAEDTGTGISSLRARLTATGIHLALTLVALAALYLVIHSYWYPDFFFMLDGGWQGLRLLGVTLLVAGPLLTLVVYRPGKWGLTTDLTLIASLQIAALTIGTWVIWQERPIALVFAAGQFFTMDRDAYLDAGVPVPDLSRYPGDWPKRIAVKLPEDRAEEGNLRSRLFRAGEPLRTWSPGYVPLRSVREQIMASDVGGKHLRQRDSETLAAWLDAHARPARTFAFVPLGARFSYPHLAVDHDDGRIAGVVPISAAR